VVIAVSIKSSKTFLLNSMDRLPPLYRNQVAFVVRRQSSGRNEVAGFTLQELLVAAAIAFLLLLGADMLMINQMKFSSKIETVQRIQEDSNRFNYLLAVETGESSSIETSAAMGSACEDSGSTPLFALVIPRNDTSNDYKLATNVSRVYYYNSGNDVKRCGPPVNRFGRLVYASNPVTGVVIRGAQLSLNVSSSSCDAEVTSTRQLVYNLKFTNHAVKNSGACVVARSRTVYVRS